MNTDSRLQSEGVKIYFAGAISAGRNHQPLYRAMVDYLHALGGRVLSAHVAKENVLEGESRLTDEDIFRRNMEYIDGSHGMVAEVTTPSLGVGFEIAMGLQLGKPTLCLCQQGTFLTRMLTGNRDRQLSVFFYKQPQDWQAALEEFMIRLRIIVRGGR